MLIKVHDLKMYFKQSKRVFSGGSCQRTACQRRNLGVQAEVDETPSIHPSNQPYALKYHDNICLNKTYPTMLLCYDLFHSNISMSAEIELTFSFTMSMKYCL